MGTDGSGAAAGERSACYDARMHTEKFSGQSAGSRSLRAVAFLLSCALATTCLGREQESPPQQMLEKEQIVQKYRHVRPRAWGWNLPGVIMNFKAEGKTVALTLDLCGSKRDGLDERIVGFLERNGIKATFFVSLRWIQKFPGAFERLSKNPLFEIENHGAAHRPASLNGRSVFGLRGTANSSELYSEVVQTADAIEQLTGRRPKFYRSGGAYYDEFALMQISDMGFRAVGFSVFGDGGTGYSANTAKKAVSKARSGDIIIAHANHQEKTSGKGVVAGLELLLQGGFEFVRLDEVLE